MSFFFYVFIPPEGKKEKRKGNDARGSSYERLTRSFHDETARNKDMDHALVSPFLSLHCFSFFWPAVIN